MWTTGGKELSLRSEMPERADPSTERPEVVPTPVTRRPSPARGCSA